MTRTAAIGWLSSLILLVTLLAQVRKQWRTRSPSGVSRWLFVGQIAASAGFLTYSMLTGDRVFIVTNAAILASALFGGAVTWLQRRRRGASRRTAEALDL